MSWATRLGHAVRGTAAVAIIGLAAGACSPAPAVTAATNAVDFGPVGTGTSATPAVVDVTVENFLPAARGLLRAVVVPYDGNPFTVDSFDCPEAEDVPVPESGLPGQPLLVTLNCHLTVGYHPTADGEFTGDVRVMMLFLPTARITLAGTTSPTPVLDESPLAVAVPLVALAALGGGLLLVRRRTLTP